MSPPPCPPLPPRFDRGVDAQSSSYSPVPRCGACASMGSGESVPPVTDAPPDEYDRGRPWEDRIDGVADGSKVGVDPAHANCSAAAYVTKVASICSAGLPTSSDPATCTGRRSPADESRLDTEAPFKNSASVRFGTQTRFMATMATSGPMPWMSWACGTEDTNWHSSVSRVHTTPPDTRFSTPEAVMLGVPASPGDCGPALLRRLAPAPTPAPAPAPLAPPQPAATPSAAGDMPSAHSRPLVSCTMFFE